MTWASEIPRSPYITKTEEAAEQTEFKQQTVSEIPQIQQKINELNSFTTVRVQYEFYYS